MTGVRGSARLQSTLAVALGVAILAVGCGEAGRGEASPPGDQPKDGETFSEGRRGDVAKKDAEGTGSETTSNAQAEKQDPRSVPGMNADAVAVILMKPDLECMQPVAPGLLYSCSGEDDPHADPTYEGRVTGYGRDRVSGVEARICGRDDADFQVVSRAFLGLIVTQLRYWGYEDTDRERVYRFVNHNLSSKQASTSVGAAEWTIRTSEDCRVLTVMPAR